MKKSNFNLAADSLAQSLTEKSWRRPIHWFGRTLVALLLLLLIAGAILLAYAAFQPVSVLLPVRVYQAERSADIDYQVEMASPTDDSLSLLGENQIYLRTLAQSVKPRFRYHWKADRSADLTWTASITATLRFRDAADPKRILYEEQTEIEPAIVLQQAQSSYDIDRAATVELAPYQAKATAFAQQSQLRVHSELVIALAIQTQAALPSGVYATTDAPALIVPLNTDTFQITESIGTLKPVRLWRWLPFQLIVQTVPFYAYPIAAMLLLAGLIVWLTLTKNRRRTAFDRQLARMQRQAHGRLMLIGDKAWEPEWCITVSDFRTMVRTARKLKHPVFCHVDRSGAEPVAFFYVYYGENNYCLTFRPSGIDEAKSTARHEAGDFKPLPDIPFSSDLNPDD